MGDNEQLQDLLKEWRISVIDKLNSLEKGQHEFNRLLTTFATKAELDKVNATQEIHVTKLEERIQKLESTYQKVIGAAVAIQLVGGILFAIIQFVFKK